MLFLDVARAAIRYLEVPVHALSFKASEFNEASGPVENTTGCLSAARSNSSLVVALIEEARNEQLAQLNPFSLVNRGGAPPDVVEQILDGPSRESDDRIR